MGKGLGIAALVIVIVSFIMPLIGTPTAMVALVVATLAALFGEQVFAIATTVIGGLKLFFLSPLHMAVMYAGGIGAFTITAALVTAPIVALIFRPAIVKMLGKNSIDPPHHRGTE